MASKSSGGGKAPQAALLQALALPHDRLLSYKHAEQVVCDAYVKVCIALNQQLNLHHASQV